MMSSFSDSDSYESDDTGTRAIKLPSQTRGKNNCKLCTNIHTYYIGLNYCNA